MVQPEFTPVEIVGYEVYEAGSSHDEFYRKFREGV